MKTWLRVWIHFIVRKPQWNLFFLVLITLFFLLGIRKIESDSSMDYLMPKAEPVYKLGERTKAAFADSKTFFITSIEASENIKLFSKETFNRMNDMVEEMEEYKDFNLNLENSRLDSIIALGNAQFTEPLTQAKTNISENGRNSQDNLEKDLDEMFLEGGDSVINLNQKKSHEDIWDMDKPLPESRYVEAIREKRIYNLEKYKPVRIYDLKEALDKTGKRSLETVLFKLDFNHYDDSYLLKKKEFSAILNGLEDIYLYKSMRIVHMFSNPISGEDISGKNGELTPVDFIPLKDGVRQLPETPEDFKKYIDKIKLNPLNENLLYSLDNTGQIRALSMTIVLRTMKHYNLFFDYFWIIIEKNNQQPLILHSMGSMVVEKYMNDYMKKDLRNLIPLVLLIVIVTFYLNFRTIAGVVLPTLTVLLGAVWTMGLMGHLGIKLSLLVNILPPLLIAVGSSYSIHMFNQYMMDRGTYTSTNIIEGMTHSMSHISMTILMAALTTTISFLTLVTSQVVSLRDFGFLAGIGALFAMVVSFVLIPGVIVLWKPKVKKTRIVKISTHKIVNKLVHKLYIWSTERTKTVVLIFVVLMVIGIIGLIKVRPETAPMYNFKDDSIIRKFDNRLSELFKGTFSINLVFDSGKINGARDPQFLNYIEGVRSWLVLPDQMHKYHILSTNSFGDFVKRMNMAVNNDQKIYYKIPDSAATINDYLEIFSGSDDNSDGRADSFEQFVDVDFRRVNLVIRTGSFDGVLFSTALNKSLQKHIKGYLDPLPHPAGITWFLSGDTINIPVLADLIVKGQIINIITSLFLIGLLVYFLFKQVKASIMSLIPVTLGVVMVYGFMGYAHIFLDIPKAILSSVIVGIGIDDTIHFMKTLAHHLKTGVNLKDAIRETYNEAALAIIYTSVALVLGFSLLIISEFQPVFFLGFLMSGVMIATTIGALLFLPAAIMFFNLKINDVDIE